MAQGRRILIENNNSIMGPVNYAGVGHSVPIHAVDSPSLYSANGNSAVLYHIFFCNCGTKLIPNDGQVFVI
jgi:hypothetical protein